MRYKYLVVAREIQIVLCFLQFAGQGQVVTWSKYDTRRKQVGTYSIYLHHYKHKNKQYITLTKVWCIHTCYCRGSYFDQVITWHWPAIANHKKIWISRATTITRNHVNKHKPPLCEIGWTVIHHADSVCIGKCHMSSNVLGHVSYLTFFFHRLKSSGDKVFTTAF